MLPQIAALLGLFCLATAKITPTTDANMNGEYLLASTPKQRANWTGWSTSFKDYPGGVEYFEVYAGPVNSTYGEVFWTALPEVKLPADLIKRVRGDLPAYGSISQ